MTMTFWIWMAALVAMSVALVLWPRRRQARADVEREALNVAVHRARLDEIDEELARGVIDSDVASSLRNEAAASLLGDHAEAAAGTAVVPAASSRHSILAYVVAALVPIAAVVWYLQFGAYERLETAAVAAAVNAAASAGGEGSGGHDDAEVKALMVRLEERLQQTPDDADGWFLLGRTALNSGDAERAARAFERVVALVPDALAATAYLAQARFLRDGNRVTDAVRESIDRVLAAMPDEPTMMELLAVDAFARGAYAETEQYLSRALANGTDPQREPFLRAGVARARELQGLPPLATQQAAVAGKSIVASVRATSELAPGGAIFVVARAQDSPMPLAVVRRPVSDLPFSVTLDREAAMSPAQTLDTATEVVVFARYSRSGSADRAESDVESPRVPLSLGSTPVTVDLVIGGSAAASTPSRAVTPARTVTPAPAVAVASTPVSEAIATGRSLRVLVELAAGMQADTTSTVFVFARERGGPPMPLAVARVPVSALPTLVQLDDSMAMTPGRTLSSAGDNVDVVARVSKSGSATPASGDIEGSAPATSDGSVVRVRLEHVLP